MKIKSDKTKITRELIMKNKFLAKKMKSSYKNESNESFRRIF